MPQVFRIRFVFNIIVKPLRSFVVLLKKTTSGNSFRPAMTTTVRVTLLAAIVLIIGSKFATSSDETTVSTVQPDLLDDVTEKFSDEFARARPQRPNSKNKPHPTPEVKVTTESAMPTENKLLEKINRDVSTLDEFWEKRNALADLEIENLLSNRMSLKGRELEANKIVLSRKFLEYDKVFSSTEIFPPSISFSQAKSLIEKSDIFKIIKKMPKGAYLYNLLITSVPLSFIYQLTFEDDLYIYFEKKLEFKFSKTPPGRGWRLLSKLRETDDPQFVADLNEEIQERLSLVVSDPEKAKEINVTFADVLDVYISLTLYKPNFEKIFKMALETLYEDNVMYAELGYDFPQVYDLSGRIHSAAEILRICKGILNEFISSHKDFVGVRFMYIPLVSLTKENLQQFRRVVTDLWKSNRDFIAGFGLLRMSESEKPWSYWAEELLKFPKEMKLFLDAGITRNWGTDTDYDLLDALTLNADAIGEGLALNKHPVVVEQLKKKDVPVICFPIWCQVTNYVPDLRNHPLTLLVALDLPLVIGNGAGTVWNDTGLSYNWYEAYLAMTPRFCDLRCLKQFAYNSWMYTSLNDEEKEKSIKRWKVNWDEFVDDVIINYGIQPRNENVTILENNEKVNTSLH